ncbi:hypothetical protein ANCCAN_20571 [Ancylostoma caninum]|uniref:Uncharacterized protein n=1 Tax=Ancylostoma caninum TaxID=29170 RepID=A0A368FNF3_ANCCA|nr:hypothetical protein ANCCAN_20571 [Ancylostoma caninum]
MRHELSDELKVVEAVAFESKRIFKDRLAHEDHVLKFEELLAYVMPTARREADNVFVSNGTVVPSHNVTGLPLVPYGKRDYQSMLQKAVNRYEFEVANFSNALTDEMCELCAKVDRALTAPGSPHCCYCFQNNPACSRSASQADLCFWLGVPDWAERMRFVSLRTCTK